MHHDDKIDDKTGKSEIILYYNQTKGAVDTVDKMCHTYSMQRKTKRRLLAYFMSLLNLGGTELLHNLQYSEFAMVPKIISQTKAVHKRSGIRLGEASDGKKSNVFCWPC